MGEKKPVKIEKDELVDKTAGDASSTEVPIEAATEPAAGKATDDGDSIEQKLETAQNEARENYDRLLRVSAEFENYKKRTNREVSDFKRYANESLIRDLLSVVDNLERAIESAKQDISEEGALVEGVEMTLSEVVKIFEKHSVKPIESLGEEFDPCFHQAMMQEEVTDKPNNIVLKELQKGYLIHDRLLRPAMVVVSKSNNEATNDN
ncbi:MAG: nucleotide exchange factor GrpE [Desulfobacteraceae bacterium]|nr:nucleotide exchange factor GrpE [Desulfobacteraceae bacterium]